MAGVARARRVAGATPEMLGRALSSEALKGQAIEIVGHTDAKGTLEYNDALSQRRAAAVVTYIVRNFTLDPALISSKGSAVAAASPMIFQTRLPLR